MKKILISILTITLIFGTPALALAQTASPSATTTTNQNSADRIAQIKSKADVEITRRITSIQELITKIQGLKRVSEGDKTNLVNMANNMISNLNTLKAKIDADTDLTTLRTDRQDIFTQYRIYMLFMPQLRIYVASDRINDTADLMTNVSTKLAARIGSNSSWQAVLSDANAKIADARSQAQNAINTIKVLQPDGGNDGIMSANKQALLSAKGMIMAAVTDLQAARKDFAQIISALKAAQPSASSSATPQ